MIIVGIDEYKYFHLHYHFGFWNKSNGVVCEIQKDNGYSGDSFSRNPDHPSDDFYMIENNLKYSEFGNYEANSKRKMKFQGRTID